MLDKIFIEVLNMSYMASIVIIAILFIRIFLKRVPKKFSYILWLIPLFRLVVPFSFESVLSLIPVNPEPIPVDIGYAISPQIKTGVSSVDYSVNSILSVPEVVTSVNPLQIIISMGTLIWIIIMIGLIVYGIGSYIKLKRQLSSAILIEDDVYSSNNIDTPFVMGIIHPKIYLPDSVHESERAYILLHEHTHIKRFDHLFRFIGFLVLCLHWFNPLVWIAYYVSGNDMELSCDESVITKLGGNVKKEYSQSLLNFTKKRARLSMSPLAFGEGDTKGRIKNILKFQKPKTYLIVLVVVALVVVSIGLLANPIKNSSESSINGNTYGVVDILFESPMYSFSYSEESAPSFTISSDYWLYSKEVESDWEAIAGLYENDMKKEELMTWIHYTDLLDEKAIDLLDEVNLVYRADTNNENGLFYLIMETKAHQILILYGYAEGEGASIRWIFEVEPLKPIEISSFSTELWNYRTEYAGDNSSVANISNQMQYPEYLEYQSISLQTENQPFGATIILNEKDGNVESSLDENTDILFKMNACILFSLVRNLDEVAFSVDGETIKTKAFTYTRTWAEELVGINLWDAGSKEESFDELLMKIKDKVTYGVDTPFDTHISSEENLLEQAISEAILSYHTQYGSIGGTSFESHKNLWIEEKEDGNEIIVYAYTMYNAFSASESGLEVLSGANGPCKMTFTKSDNDHFELVEYWIPRDGSYNMTDIVEMFPDEIEEEALNTSYYLDLKQSCYRQAVEALDINVDRVISGLLQVIISSPMESSNPGDYIDAHQIEYRELTYYGDYMIAFIANDQEQGGTGLKSRILEILYDDMTL